MSVVGWNGRSQKCHVAEQGHKIGSARIALDTATMLRQNNERKVGPRWLEGHPVSQCAKVSTSGELPP